MLFINFPCWNNIESEIEEEIHHFHNILGYAGSSFTCSMDVFRCCCYGWMAVPCLFAPHATSPIPIHRYVSSSHQFRPPGIASEHWRASSGDSRNKRSLADVKLMNGFCRILNVSMHSTACIPTDIIIWDD